MYEYEENSEIIGAVHTAAAGFHIQKYRIGDFIIFDQRHRHGGLLHRFNLVYRRCV